ncbi:hypothetical protein [Kitasatospora sp. NPDC002965]|uniref:hypothetical protein n=1 Tax=Kitasatospora sp. NPDC002965 TaxID=3154775 RepID=UPI0033B4915D
MTYTEWEHLADTMAADGASKSARLRWSSGLLPKVAWRGALIGLLVTGLVLEGHAVLPVESRTAAAAIDQPLPAATPLVLPLQDSPQPATPTPEPAPPASVEPPDEPASDTTPEPESAQSPRPSRATPTHRPRPSHGGRPEEPPKQPAPGRPPAVPGAPADLCAEGSRYGQLPGDLVQMCRQLLG